MAANDTVQTRLLAALRDAGTRGLTGAEQDRVFNGSLRARQLREARDELEARGLIRVERVPPGPKGGRPRITAFALDDEKLAPKNSRAKTPRPQKLKVTPPEKPAAPIQDDAIFSPSTNEERFIPCRKT